MYENCEHSVYCVTLFDHSVTVCSECPFLLKGLTKCSLNYPVAVIMGEGCNFVGSIKCKLIYVRWRTEK